MAKFHKRIQARKFRKAGQSLKSIATRLNVSKSTASIWCSDIILSQEQVDALYKKMVDGGYKGRLLGARMQREEKLRKIENYVDAGIKEINRMSDRDLMLVGLGLYWGEGNKKGNQFQFVNSDPSIISVVLKWLSLFDITSERLYCNIIINDIHKHRVKDVEKIWSKITNIPLAQFKKTILIHTVSRKVYENKSDHLGTLILRVYKSSHLLYRILGLIRGLGYNLEINKNADVAQRLERGPHKA